MRPAAQADINAFVNAAAYGSLTSEGIKTALVAKRVPINGGNSAAHGCTALHQAVKADNRPLVAELLAAGADPRLQTHYGKSPVWWAMLHSTAETLRLLIEGGGSVNDADCGEVTPLVALVKNNPANAAGCLGVLLARPELDLDAKVEGKTASEWATEKGHTALADPITTEARAAGAARSVAS